MESKIYTQNTNLAFVADQAAETDALLTFLIESIRSANDFAQLQSKLDEGLKEVKITRSIDIEDFLDAQDSGWALVIRKIGKPDEGDEIGGNTMAPDYLRNDDGLPVIFRFKSDAFIAVPEGYEFVRTIDLKERHERKA
jgi:hypothetical protein